MIVKDLIKMLSKVARNFLTIDYAQTFEEQFFITENHIAGYEHDCFLINASDETLKKWEKFMKITPAIDATLVSRRMKIISILNFRGTCTTKFIKEQFYLLSGSDVDVIEYFSQYFFTVNFPQNSTPDNINDFYYVLNINKPAHLGYGFEFSDKKEGYLYVVSGDVNYGQNTYLPQDIF